jgi:hypothetical protein
MSFFHKKQPENPLGERLSLVTNAPAREFGQAKSFAMMLANERRSRTIEIADVLAGVYIAHFEKLAKYWADPEALEAFVEDHCHINSAAVDLLVPELPANVSSISVFVLCTLSVVPQF